MTRRPPHGRDGTDTSAASDARRLFVGVPLPAEAAVEITRIVDSVRAMPLPAGARDVRWVQEEPANQGAWSFIALNLLEHLEGVRLRRISRPAAAAPAVGSTKMHDVEQAALIEAAMPQQ